MVSCQTGPTWTWLGFGICFRSGHRLAGFPVAGDGCGNYYVLTEDGTVGFVEPMSDPGRLERQVSADLLSFMTDLLAADQVLPSG